jgi:hypothetical protein
MPQKMGTFISDRDAAILVVSNAHLWDNGKDPVNELKKCEGSSKSVIAIWRKQHSQRHTNGNAEEDVLVPIYLFHRYQIEAVSKVVGGLYYSYAVKETDK